MDEHLENDQGQQLRKTRRKDSWWKGTDEEAKDRGACQIK